MSGLPGFGGFGGGGAFQMPTPETPWGCLWHFLGFCLFSALVFAVAHWVL